MSNRNEYIEDATMHTFGFVCGETECQRCLWCGKCEDDDAMLLPHCPDFTPCGEEEDLTTDVYSYREEYWQYVRQDETEAQ